MIGVSYFTNLSRIDANGTWSRAALAKASTSDRCDFSAGEKKQWTHGESASDQPATGLK